MQVASLARYSSVATLWLKSCGSTQPEKPIAADKTKIKLNTVKKIFFIFTPFLFVLYRTRTNAPNKKRYALVDYAKHTVKTQTVNIIISFA